MATKAARTKQTEQMKPIPEKPALEIQSDKVPKGVWDDCPSYYSNTISLILSGFDIRFLFSETIPSGTNSVITQPRASVVISPQHAKAFLSVLQKRLADYEREHGEIVWQAKKAPEAN